MTSGISPCLEISLKKKEHFNRGIFFSYSAVSFLGNWFWIGKHTTEKCEQQSLLEFEKKKERQREKKDDILKSQAERHNRATRFLGKTKEKEK